MKLFLLALTILCLTIYSCGQNDNKTPKETSKENTTHENSQAQQTPEATQLNKENVATDKTQEKKESSDKNAGGIRVDFPTGATQVSLNGKISGFGNNITYVFEVSKGQKLNASVKPQAKTAM